MISAEVKKGRLMRPSMSFGLRKTRIATGATLRKVISERGLPRFVLNNSHVHHEYRNLIRHWITFLSLRFRCTEDNRKFALCKTAARLYPADDVTPTRRTAARKAARDGKVRRLAKTLFCCCGLEAINKLKANLANCRQFHIFKNRSVSAA